MRKRNHALVAGPSYHERGMPAMARRKFRAIYRQFFGAIADIIAVH